MPFTFFNQSNPILNGMAVSTRNEHDTATLHLSLAWGVTQKKFWGGQSHKWFWKVRSKKKRKKNLKKGSSPHFVTFPPSIFNFPPSLLQFSFFSSQFSPLFPISLPLFPGRSAAISWSEVSGGHSAPLPVTPLSLAVSLATVCLPSQVKYLLRKNAVEKLCKPEGMCKCGRP